MRNQTHMKQKEVSLLKEDGNSAIAMQRRTAFLMTLICHVQVNFVFNNFRSDIIC